MVVSLIPTNEVAFEMGAGMKLFGVFLGGLCFRTGAYGLYLDKANMLLVLSVVFGVWLFTYSMGE